MLVTYYDAYSVLTKIYSSGAFVKQALNDTIIEEKNRSATTKICYGVLDKDITLNYVIKNLSQKTPKLAIRILLKIAIYSIAYLNTPAHAVINTTVELVKKLGKGGTAGFVNALLRNYVRKGVELPSGNDAYSLSIKYSYPEFAVESLLKGYGLNATIDILNADTERTYIQFSNNCSGEEYLKNLNKTYELTPFNNLYEVKNFKMDGGFYEGLYTFQSIGSVAICNGVITDENGAILGDLKGKTLLDSCSAPGGKSVYLSDYFSAVTACELHEHRVELINSYASRMNKTNVTAIQKDATILDAEFINKFDYVLVDSPCSGLGVTKDNPDIKLNRSKEDVKSLIKTQISILKTQANYVKKGGYLCYSTCSILPEENDGVISQFLSEVQGFTVEKTVSKLPSVKTKYGLQFLPNLSYGAGFYFTKLKKV